MTTQDVDLDMSDVIVMSTNRNDMVTDKGWLVKYQIEANTLGNLTNIFQLN